MPVCLCLGVRGKEVGVGAQERGCCVCWCMSVIDLDVTVCTCESLCMCLCLCLCLCQGPAWGNTYGPQSQVLRRSLSGQKIKAARAGQGLSQRAGSGGNQDNSAGEGAGWSQVEDQFAASLSMGPAEERWRVGRGGGSGEGGTDGAAGRPHAGLQAASGDHNAARRCVGGSMGLS